eukprot:SAG11_NODE_1485_length_4822_cov_4.117298_6_plen_66_part_00
MQDKLQVYPGTHCTPGNRTVRGSTEVPTVLSTVLAVYLNMVQYWKQGEYLLIRKNLNASFGNVQI